jgi:hypothetical protein
MDLAVRHASSNKCGKTANAYNQSLFDNTLLHELCHTFSGGDLDDKGFLFAPYGWKNIVRKNAARSIQNAGMCATSEAAWLLLTVK